MKTKKIHVVVRQSHIDSAEARKSHRCAVANGVAEVIPGALSIEVDVQTIRWSINGRRHIHPTPKKAIALGIAPTDNQESRKPFSFDLTFGRGYYSRKCRTVEPGFKRSTKRYTKRGKGAPKHHKQPPHERLFGVRGLRKEM